MQIQLVRLFFFFLLWDMKPGFGLKFGLRLENFIEGAFIYGNFPTYYLLINFSTASFQSKH